MRSSDINVHRFLQLYVRTDLDAKLYYELTCPEIIITLTPLCVATTFIRMDTHCWREFELRARTAK